MVPSLCYGRWKLNTLNVSQGNALGQDLLGEVNYEYINTSGNSWLNGMNEISPLDDDTFFSLMNKSFVYERMK